MISSSPTEYTLGNSIFSAVSSSHVRNIRIRYANSSDPIPPGPSRVAPYLNEYRIWGSALNAENRDPTRLTAGRSESGSDGRNFPKYRIGYLPSASVIGGRSYTEDEMFDWEVERYGNATGAYNYLEFKSDWDYFYIFDTVLYVNGLLAAKGINVPVLRCTTVRAIEAITDDSRFYIGKNSAYADYKS